MKFNFGTGIFLALAAFVLFMLYFFLRTPSQTAEVITQHAYEEGNEYQKQLDDQNRARKFGSLTLFAKAPLTVELILPGDSVNVGTVTGKATFARPDRGGADVQLDIRGGLRQTLRDARLTSGRWRVRVQWVQSGQSFYDEALIDLP
jgi:hypothetical protein